MRSRPHGRRTWLEGLFAATLAPGCLPGAVALRITRGRRAPEGAPGGALVLAATLPAEERRALFEAVDGLLASLEARENPLLVDFAEATAEDLFATRRAWLGPCARVALAVGRNGYPLDDDGAYVEACPSGWRTLSAAGDRDGSGVAEMARRAAWPVSSALVIGSRSSEEAHRARDVLATLAIAENGLIGGLWSDACAHLASDGLPVGFLERAARLAARSPPTKGKDAAILRDLRAAFEPPPRAGMLPYWPRQHTELIVLPRRGALARSRELWTTVQAALAQAGIRGVLRPA